MDKIKILYVGYSTNFGGIERFLINVCRNIDRKKFDISIMTFKGNEVCNQKELEELGIKFISITHRRKNYIRFLKELKEVYLSNDFDYIHFNLVNYKCPERILYAKKYSKAKIIIHSHNASLKNFELTHEIGKILLKNINCVRFACGKEAGNFLFDDKEFIVINNGLEIDSLKFSVENRNKIRKELNIQDNEVVIGLVAKFEEQKNHNFLIDVFYEYQHLNSKGKLVLVGEGSLLDEMKSKVKILNLQDKVLFLGKRDDTDKIYSAIDVFVMPSWFEGLSISIVEAQVNGLKCYTSTNVDRESDVSGNVEFLSLDKGAKYWAEKILENDNSRDEQALEKIPDKFKIEETIKVLTNIYEEK